MGRRAVKSAVVLAMCAGALAGGAQAGTGDVVGSKVTLEVKRDVRFKGIVKSPASDCAIGRKVLLYRVKPGRDQKIGKAFTSESGKYAVTIPMQNGNRIYALVRRLRTPLDTICKRARSPAVTV
jgi:hypothetical protein